MAKGNKQYQRKNIRACVYSIRDGLTEIDHVDFIRIKSKEYGLLIMEDYMPMLGEIDGSLAIQAEGKLHEWKHVEGYYIHQKNLFRMMIKMEEEEAHELSHLSGSQA